MPIARIFSSNWRLLTAVTALAVAVGVFGEGPSAQHSTGATFSINDVSVTEGHRLGVTLATFTVTLANAGALTSEARVTWATADGSATAPGITFTSAGVISIPTAGVASPYPSSVFVGGIQTQLTHVKVRLNSLVHTFPGDIDALLVGPGGQKVMLMSGAWNGFNGAPPPVNLTFEDGAPSAPLLGSPVAGTYSPTNYLPGSSIPAPAPAAPYSSALSAFDGTNPNGTWFLYVNDHGGGNSGTIGGFSLTFPEPPSEIPMDDYSPASGQLIFPVGGPATQTVSVRVIGDNRTEPDETFFVNLSQPTGASISKAQGVGTILNDDGIIPPTVVTGAASSITSTTATLNGTVTPNGLDTTAGFEYGKTTSYGATTAFLPMGSGSLSLPIGGGALAGLACNTTYHFRAVAGNAGGTMNGLDATFTTGSCVPIATTGFPTSFTATGALLNGTANPKGSATTAWFEYRLTPAYGSSTPIQGLGAGGVAVAIGGGTVSDLACDTVYHFRARATNANGTANGLDQTFSPPCAGTISPTLLAVANDSNALRVFNAATLATVATITVPSSENFDVVIMPNQSLAFAARNSGIWVVDLTQSPPVLAAGLNPIPIPAGMPFVEDMSLTRDGRFLVVSDGLFTAPIAVIDTATRSVVSSMSVLGDHNSVEVCDNRSVLVTSIVTGVNVVRRLIIGASGTLADTGQSLTLPGAGPNNTACAPGGVAGVVVNQFTGDMRSFLVNGMTLVSTQVLPGVGLGVGLVISSDGTKVFVRSSEDLLTAYAFNPTTGAVGGQLWSKSVGPTTALYGVDQIALDPGGRRVYASTSGLVVSLNASNGVLNGGAFAVSPTGIALRRGTTLAGDFDGDTKDDLALYRPSTGNWYVKQSGANYTTALIQSFGAAGDVPVAGDYDGDGSPDFALYRPSNGTWYVLKSSTDFTAVMVQAWGLSTDIPVPGDYDGDGKTDFGLFRPSTGTWYVLLSGANYTTAIIQGWGVGTDLPLPGDYDGDGKADLGLYRPSSGTWYVLKSSTNFTTAIIQSWGLNTDIAVPGDYDGDGKVDPAVYRPSTGVWYLLQSSTNYTTFVSQSWGLGTDIPVPGDYDGDGKTDLGLYRPSTGNWYLLTSSSNYTTFIGQTWGLGTDTPLLRRP